MVSRYCVVVSDQVTYIEAEPVAQHSTLSENIVIVDLGIIASTEESSVLSNCLSVTCMYVYTLQVKPNSIQRSHHTSSAETPLAANFRAKIR